MHIEIHFKRGADVSVLSAYPGEREVVLPPGSFQVTHKERTPHGWYYRLTQVR
jgi:hypothetical protein